MSLGVGRGGASILHWVFLIQSEAFITEPTLMLMTDRLSGACSARSLGQEVGLLSQALSDC